MSQSHLHHILLNIRTIKSCPNPIKSKGNIMRGTIRITLPWLFEAEFEIQTNRKVKKIAWELYCELSTRVGVIDFKEIEDLFINCFDSWYAFFKFARKKVILIGPPKKNKKGDKKYNIISIVLSLLNDQLRPFLRKWHNRFTHFWKNNIDQADDLIALQKLYPDYNSLIEDLKQMSIKLKQTSEMLNKISIS